MSKNKKYKTDNKIFQDIIDFEILKSLFDYLLISKKNKNKNNNHYKINRFYLNRNEILNYILVSKKWYDFISLTISNNIINNNLLENWLKINYNKNKSFIENYNNKNQYDKNYLISKYIESNQNIISFNKEFSIIKIQESILNDFFKFNLFIYHFTIDDFKEIINKFKNNQLLYNRIVVNFKTGFDEILFKIHEYVSSENSEIISNLFRILELNHDFMIIDGYIPNSKEEEEDGNNKKCTVLYLNNLQIAGFDREIGEDREAVKIFKIFKSKNIIYDSSDIYRDTPTHVNYSALFDPDNSGQQVESIKLQSELDQDDFVEPIHLMKLNQFENLHSITIILNLLQISSNLSKELGYFSTDGIESHFGNSDNMKSELNQMISSFITSKSLKNLKISSVNSTEDSINHNACYNGGDLLTFINKINESKDSFSNSFKPLFSELNTSIERIEFDCCCLLNINTFSNLLNNKSIKYLYLFDSDFILSSLKPTNGCNCDDNKDGIDKDDVDGGEEEEEEDDDVGEEEEEEDEDDYSEDEDDDDSQVGQKIISINQYLFDNILSSPLTSIRHYRICFKESKQIKFIFNLILDNIYKLQLYSLIFEFLDYELIDEFVEEFKNFINNISTQLQKQQQQQQQEKSNNINLKEIKIKMFDEDYLEEFNNINSPYFKIIIKNCQ
ncbi:hypothetical protein ACTFIY_008749 [Dictyostelium cf. discoideum]